jgi:hypothetical protein
MPDDSQSDETVELTDDNTKISARVAAGVRYVLGDVIGKGGMGEVLGATDSQLAGCACTACARRCWSSRRAASI